ncbi:MAG: hypothetical protein LBH68_08995 [Bifidobacteriaceae bacterium]|jgi:hypothetical protein|nr:hypothetical protein [Bifidobacteriaceae bacterium]
MRKNARGRLVAASLGGVLLVGVAAGAAQADPIENLGLGEGGDVALHVTLEEEAEPGLLSMQVAGDAVTLTGDTRETGAQGDEFRVFTGELPEVTVTDTRDRDDATHPINQSPTFRWYVIGEASPFADDNSTLPNIDAKHLGWAPRLTGSNPSFNVSAGSPIDAWADVDPSDPDWGTWAGLGEAWSLFEASSSYMVNPERSWTAGASLFLKVPVATAAGSYTSIVTLTLFEDDAAPPGP